MICVTLCYLCYLNNTLRQEHISETQRHGTAFSNTIMVQSLRKLEVALMVGEQTHGTKLLIYVILCAQINVKIDMK